MDDLPALPGAYVLELYLSYEALITVGRLGSAYFPAGTLLYLGSACGPGGLKARLGRHLRGESTKHPHWHIDYLRRVARVCAFSYLVQAEVALAAPLECLWSQALARLPGSCVPLAGFGASDCHSGCPAHLVAFPGDEKDSHPLLVRSGWQELLARTAGEPSINVQSLA